MGWDHDGTHPERLGQLAPEEGSCAAEREQGHPPRIEPAGDTDPLERARHHRCGDGHNARRDRTCIARHAERAQRLLRGVAIEPHSVRERMLGIEPPQHQARVGDGGSARP